MPSVPPTERVFSPLDDELKLLPGGLTPSLVEGMVKLASWMPFARAGEMLGHFTKVEIPTATVRRATEIAGWAYVHVQETEVTAIEEDLPQAPGGPEVQQVSVDGAMVPLVRKEWAEVKTLAIGRVEGPILER